MVAVEMLSEPVCVPDVYASGISHFEQLGDGNVRITYYVNQKSIHGGMEWNVVSRIIMPTSAIHMAVKMVARDMGCVVCGEGVMKSRH